MNFIILASTLILALIIAYFTKRNSNMQENEETAFWDKEYKSNFVRKKPLDNLNYITIPEDILTMHPAHASAQTLSYLQDLKDMSSLSIVNLTGISNTDLKLTYGTANITVLSEYDSHYTQLVTILQKLAESLVASDEKALAARVLEFSISTGSDVSKSYYLLSDLYTQAGTPEKISFLIQHAQGIQSIMKDSILRNLKTSCQ